MFNEVFFHITFAGCLEFTVLTFKQVDYTGTLVYNKQVFSQIPFAECLVFTMITFKRAHLVGILLSIVGTLMSIEVFS